MNRITRVINKGLRKVEEAHRQRQKARTLQAIESDMKLVEEQHERWMELAREREENERWMELVAEKKEATRRAWCRKIDGMDKPEWWKRQMKMHPGTICMI